MAMAPLALALAALALLLPFRASAVVSITAPNEVMSSALLNVSWSGADPTSLDDWIGFWNSSATAPPTAFGQSGQSWRYTYGGQAKLNSNRNATVAGTIAITAPSKVGSYTLWYCTNSSYTCTASIPVTVIPAVVPAVKCSKKGKSKVKHLVIIQTENHSFDSTFGSYCKAPTGSWPQGNYGPLACEAPPATVSGHAPVDLANAENTDYDPNHSAAAETCEINGGAMDQYVAGCPSSSPMNFAVMDTSATGDGAWYGKVASNNAFTNLNSAIADNFFQPAIGASCENDMFVAIPQYLFQDNDIVAQNCSLNGMACYCAPGPWPTPAEDFESYTAPTIFDLLIECGISWKAYAEGYDAFPKAGQCYGNYFDATDFAESFFPSLTKPQYWADSSQFLTDVLEGTLPTVSHVRSLGNASEHPDWGVTPSTDFLASITDAIDQSPIYSDNTLILIVPDESGGFYDHVKPPTSPNAIDGVFYGPRIGAIAIGKMVHWSKDGFVAHQFMETSSIIKFIEWNWLGGRTGQLKGRDQVVANLGSFLDPKAKVPVY